MLEVRISAADLAARCADVQRGLREERLGRLELSDLEHTLEGILQTLAPVWQDVERNLGPTPEVRLAQAALQALEESVQWAHAYRKHAPLRERRERVERGVEGALGATSLLRRLTPLRHGPQLADEGKR